jgi:hypothetical protein
VKKIFDIRFSGRSGLNVDGITSRGEAMKAYVAGSVQIVGN